MASESAAPQPGVMGEQRPIAEEDQAQLDRICLFLKERRRLRRRRAAAVTAVTAGVLLVGTIVGWHLRDRVTEPTSAASDPSPAVTGPVASQAPTGTARAQISAAERLPAAPSLSHEQKPGAKPSDSVHAPSKTVRNAHEAIPPPKFLKRARPSREAPARQPAGEPAPGPAIRPAGTEDGFDGNTLAGSTLKTGVRLDDDRVAPRSPPRAVAPPPRDPPAAPRKYSAVESP